MTQSPLFLSYGMPKSGSTLAFELTCTLLELAGVGQPKIAEGVTDPATKINFVSKLDGDALAKLLEDAKGISRPIVIKTHSHLYPKVKNALQRGDMMGQAVCRDPRDMALSMLDAAREGRAWGANDGEVFRSVKDTECRLRKSIEQFEAWASMPNVMAIHYERLAFDTETVAAEIAAQLGITADLRRGIEIATGKKFTQFNQGRSQRWKTDMDPADARRLETLFSDYIGKYCGDIPDSPKARKPATRLFGRWFSLKSQKSR